MKVLRCRDAGFDCDHEIRGQTEGEVLNQAAQHAQTVHHVQMTPDMARQVQGFVRDENPPKETMRTD